MLTAAAAIAFSASPTDEATGHRNCGGSTASFAVCGPNTTGRCASYSIRISVAADRKSTRLNSSHGYSSYAVFCLKKKNKKTQTTAYSHCTNDNSRKT